MQKETKVRQGVVVSPFCSFDTRSRFRGKDLAHPLGLCNVQIMPQNIEINLILNP